MLLHCFDTKFNVILNGKCAVVTIELIINSQRKCLLFWYGVTKIIHIPNTWSKVYLPQGDSTLQWEWLINNVTDGLLWENDNRAGIEWLYFKLNS